MCKHQVVRLLQARRRRALCSAHIAASAACMPIGCTNQGFGCKHQVVRLLQARQGARTVLRAHRRLCCMNATGGFCSAFCILSSGVTLFGQDVLRQPAPYLYGVCTYWAKAKTRHQQCRPQCLSPGLAVHRAKFPHVCSWQQNRTAKIPHAEKKQVFPKSAIAMQTVTRHRLRTGAHSRVPLVSGVGHALIRRRAIARHQLPYICASHQRGHSAGGACRRRRGARTRRAPPPLYRRVGGRHIEVGRPRVPLRTTARVLWRSAHTLIRIPRQECSDDESYTRSCRVELPRHAR